MLDISDSEIEEVLKCLENEAYHKDCQPHFDDKVGYN